MPDDEITPQWGKAANVPAVGIYIWTLRILKATSKDPGTAKPYVLLHFQVLSGDQLGYEFDGRMYYHQKAESRCKWLLKKFKYPADMLDAEEPKIKLPMIMGLSGKARVEVTITTEGDQEYMNHDLKAFERLEENDLEEKLEKERAARAGEGTLNFQPKAPPPAVPELDINGDLQEDRDRQANADLAALDSSYLDGIDEPEDLGF